MVIIKGNDVRLKQEQKQRQEQRIQEKFKDISSHIMTDRIWYEYSAEKGTFFNLLNTL